MTANVNKLGVDRARRALLGAGAAAFAVEALGMLGCGDDAAAETTSGGASGTGGSGGGADAATTSEVATSAEATSSTSTGASGGWATGGTASIGDDYPDPFVGGVGPTCSLICATTAGPCYAATLDRKDISEGYPGLPTRLALLIVDDTCAPVEGAIVDIWHTSNEGRYSGDDTSSFCTGDDPDAVSHRYFRGTQTTDASGRVDFDTCFPGWYPGRAIHIHFTVRSGGQDYLTSQIFWPQDVIADIFATQPDYATFGQPDTPNASDSIYEVENEVSWEKMADGSMLAFKALVIRSSLSDPLCG